MLVDLLTEGIVIGEYILTPIGIVLIALAIIAIGIFVALFVLRTKALEQATLDLSAKDVKIKSLEVEVTSLKNDLAKALAPRLNAKAVDSTPDTKTSNAKASTSKKKKA